MSYYSFFLFLSLYVFSTVSSKNTMWSKYTERFNLNSSDTLLEKIYGQNIIFAKGLSKFVNFELGESPFSHLTQDQFSSRFTEFSTDRVRNEKKLSVSFRGPSSKDWVQDGCVTPVKNQGQCGSCWSFSTAGVMEGANCVENGKLVDLSEQQLVSCANKINMGCDGGNVDWTFHYLERNEHCSEKSYPYVSAKGQVPECHECEGAVNKVSEFVDVPKGDEEELRKAVMINPVAIAIQASQAEFQLYKSGVMNFDCGDRLDHAVLLVGYGTDEDGTDYWKIKNSWGTEWGEDGYFRLVRGKNSCGCADSASYPIL